MLTKGRGKKKMISSFKKTRDFKERGKKKALNQSIVCIGWMAGTGDGI
jgi:hypothetical protein